MPAAQLWADPLQRRDDPARVVGRDQLLVPGPPGWGAHQRFRHVQRVRPGHEQQPGCGRHERPTPGGGPRRRHQRHTRSGARGTAVLVRGRRHQRGPGRRVQPSERRRNRPRDHPPALAPGRFRHTGPGGDASVLRQHVREQRKGRLQVSDADPTRIPRTTQRREARRSSAATRSRSRESEQAPGRSPATFPGSNVDRRAPHPSPRARRSR